MQMHSLSREISQLRHLVTEQEDAVMRLEAHSQHLVSQQQEQQFERAQRQGPQSPALDARTSKPELRKNNL